MKQAKLLFSAFFLLIAVSLSAQNRQVTGVVRDAVSGEGVPFAAVVVQGTMTGTASDADGNYSINVPANGTLVFSAMGYITKSVPVEGRSSMNISLEPDSETLNEVVVTAMGISRSEKSLGYAATTVKSDEIVGQRATNVTNALAGKVAGLQVQSTSTDPGAATSVTIRGFSSITGSNQPLYVVDGVPLASVTLTTQGHAMNVGGISNLSPDDIESMTVLKGAAATALYGSRAANGVILVTTKAGSGTADRNFTIEYNGGMQARQISVLPIFQNDYGQGWNGQQTFIENGSWGPKFDGSRQVYGPIWNKQQLIHDYSAVPNNVRDFFDVGWSQNHSIAFSGVSSDKRMTYYLSYAHNSDDGIIPGKVDTYNRNTISMRSSYEPTNWLKVSSQMNFTKSKTDMVGSFQGTSVIDGILEMPRDISIPDMRDTSSPFFTPEAYYTPYGITNPYWALENNYNHTDQKQIFGKVQVDAKPIKNLTLSYRFGFDYSDYDRKVGTPQISLDDHLIDEDYGYAPSNMNADGAVSASYYRRYETNHDFLANYQNKFVDSRLDLNATVGVNMNERASTSISGSSEVLTFYSGFWDLSNGSSGIAVSESQSMRRLVGLFGNVALGWDDTFFLELTARNDWSSTLPLARNNYFYPGVTGSWVFSNHLPKNDVLTFGKLRLAYGKTGNDAGVYNTNPVYVQASFNGYYGNGIADFPINGINAFRRTYSISSQTLRPEMTSEFEVGTNLQFFNGRIGLDAAYYNKTTSDQIFSVSIDPAVGYTSAMTNFGDVNNHGVELLLSLTPIHTRLVRWDVDINFAKNYSKVVSLPEDMEGKVNIYSFSAGNDAVYMYAEEGKPLGTFWCYLPKFVEDKTSPYYGYQIVGADGQPVQGSEVEPTGLDMNHKWTGGITTSLSIGNFSLSATLDVRYGGHMFSRTKNLMQFTGNGLVTTYNDRRPFVIPNSVVEADGGYVLNDTPILLTDSSYQTWFNDHGAGQANQFYLMDRSFAKLRNISVSYNLPRRWIGPFRGIGISAFVNNAFVWTAADNLYVDPETTTTGSDLSGSFGETYSNPSCRIYGFNVNIKF